eukprot:GGOE01044228.1.p1 GENE.GGOE01044228.1~~GGOE01044228.1.p1  ORF type:complete len:1175 (+),score=274.81 GGOE01044228.1:57-3527(+)
MPANDLLVEKSTKMWDALRKAQRAVYLIGQDVKKIQCKVAELNRPVALEQAQEECYTFRLQLTDQTYHKAVTSIKKVMQSGGTCVVSRAGESSSLHIHSSFPIDALLQKLKLSKGDVKVEQQAAFFFNVLGLTAEGEQIIEEAFNCNALGGFINAAAVSGATLAVFTKPTVMRSPDVLPELFTVSLSFDRHHCPLSRALPLSKPYKLGVFGMWCTTQTLFTIKAALEEKLGDIGLISVVTNPYGRAIAVYVQGLENALKGRSKLVSIVKGLGYRCAPKNNRVLLFDTFGPHVANLHKEVKVDTARSNAAQYQEALDPQIATPDPDQSLLRTSILNTLRNLGYAATVTGCAEVVFNLHGVKCVNCAGKIRQAIQQGPHKHLSGYLNLFRNQLTVKTSDDAVEDAIAQIAKALRAIKVQADPVRVSHDVSDEPDPVTEEEYSILRRLSGKVLLRKDIGEENIEAFSDDSDALRSMNCPITTAAFHVTGLTCQSCALLLRGTLKTVLQGITSCAIDFASRTLYVSYGSEAISPDEIREKLASLGHSAALLQEGEDLKLKLTDTLWANENAAIPTEDEKTQAMLDSQLLLHELQPQPITPQPMLEEKHYAPLEETGVEVSASASGSSVPTFHHVATLPIKLLQDPKDPKNLPVYSSVFSQAASDRDGLDDEDEAKSKVPHDTLNEAFFLVLQSPSLFSKDAQNISLRAPGLDYLEPPMLHFAHQWTFWFDVTVDTKEKNAEDSLRELGTFSTVQEFWKYWTNLCISHLTDGCNLRLFRHDIQPTWEHPKNRNGGRWSARSLGKGRRFKLWTEVVLSLLGEQLQDNSEHQVCGICLSSKPGGDRIEVWVDGGHESQDNGGDKEVAGDTMDEILRKMLFPDEDKKYFFYQSHLDYIEQRKTQRGGRRAKARKQNQGDGTFDQERSEEPRPRYYQDYDYTPTAAQGYLGSSSTAYRSGYGGGDMRSSGVLPGPRPSHHMPPRAYPPPQTHPAYYGGKGGYHPKPQYPSYQPYMGYPPHMGHGGKGAPSAAHSPFMHMQRQFMSSPPTMTPGEADNILAMHSMSGSGLSAPEPPPWSVDVAKNVTATDSEAEKGEEEDFDPTSVGMEVGQLLEELHLEQYVPVMMQKGYEDWTSMQELSETDLVEMGFKPGHRKRLLASLRSGH